MEALLTRLNHLSHWEIAFIASYLLYQGFIFTIFPEEVVITTLGFLWSQQKIGFIEAFAAVAIGLLPSNATTVFIASRFGTKVLKVRPFSWFFKKEWTDEAFKKIRQYGNWVIFFTRFIPMIRGPIYFACGLSRIRVKTFMMIDALAASIQIPVLLFIGKTIGENVGSANQGYKKLGFFVVVLFVCVFLFGRLFGKKFKRSKKSDPQNV